MAVRKLRPTTPGQRHKIIGTFDTITASAPEKSLVSGTTKSGGRNHDGKMTMRYLGGGHKRKYRVIDFKRNKDGVPATVKSIEYDPNRSARIALLYYADGVKTYILAPNGLQVGQTVVSGADAAPEVGNAIPMANIPLGTIIHNIELQKGKGGQLVRAAGNSAQLMAKEGDYATLRLPSGEMRYVRIECRATIGTLSNTTNDIVNIGKAGRKRHMGWRPTVRGSVMNPNDHPHGGGEGNHQLVDQVQLLHGVNQHLDIKLEKLRNIQINLLSKIEALSSLRRIVSSLHNLELCV